MPAFQRRRVDQQDFAASQDRATVGEDDLYEAVGDSDQFRPLVCEMRGSSLPRREVDEVGAQPEGWVVEQE